MTKETTYNFKDSKARPSNSQLKFVSSKFSKKANGSVDWIKQKRINATLISFLVDPDKAKSYGFKDGYTMNEAHKQINAKTLNKGITKAIKDWQVANAVEA